MQNPKLISYSTESFWKQGHVDDWKPAEGKLMKTKCAQHTLYYFSSNKYNYSPNNMKKKALMGLPRPLRNYEEG